MKASGKKLIVILASVVLVVMLAASLALIFFNRNRAEDFYHETAAERWQDRDTSCAEVSVYFEENSGIATPDIAYAVNNITGRLKADNYLKAGQDGLNWFYAYSGSAAILLEHGPRQVFAEAYGVEGEFFKIHEMPLISGSYFESGEQRHVVVLDEFAAWELFGAVDVAGMEVLVENDFYTVTGVVKADDSKDAMAAYGDRPKAYIPFNALLTVSPGLKAVNVQAVIPNPVDGYAKSVVSDAFGIRNPSIEELGEQKSPLNFENRIMVENTGRFGFLRLREKLKYDRYSVMQTDGIRLPYWENIARFEEERQLKRYRLAIVLMVPPLLALLIAVILIFRAIPFMKILRWTGKRLVGIKEKIVKGEK